VRRLLLTLSLLTLAGPAFALALLVPLDHLITDSDVIVKARVTGLASHWNDDHSTIVTDVTLTVMESWAGGLAPGSPLTLQVQGGEVGDERIAYEHMTVFSPEEETVLFLKATTSARFRVNAVEQGKYTVLGDQVVDFRQQALPLSALRATVNSLKPANDR
jgi:hypothetical protein